MSSKIINTELHDLFSEYIKEENYAFQNMEDRYTQFFYKSLSVCLEVSEQDIHSYLCSGKLPNPDFESKVERYLKEYINDYKEFPIETEMREEREKDRSKIQFLHTRLLDYFAKSSKSRKRAKRK